MSPNDNGGGCFAQIARSDVSLWNEMREALWSYSEGN